MKVSGIRRLFVVQKEGDSPSLRDLREGFERTAFRPLNKAGGEESSVGTCGFDDEDSTEVDLRGERLCFGLRVDTLRPPAAVIARMVREACDALERETGEMPNKYQRQAAREDAVRSWRQVTHPTTKHYQVVWDFSDAVVYIFNAPASVPEVVGGIIERASEDWDWVETGMSEGVFSRNVRSVGYDVARRRCLSGPFDARECYPNAIGGAPRDFVDCANVLEHQAKEFLLWLLHRETLVEPGITRQGGGQVKIWSDDMLELSQDKARVTLRGGHPASAGATGRALQAGYMPTSMRVGVERWESEASQAFGCRAVLRAPDLSLTGVKLPPTFSRDEDAQFLDTMDKVEELCRCLDEALEAFALERESQDWPQVHEQIRGWAERLGNGDAQDAGPADDVWHHTSVPGEVWCMADYPNMQSTDVVAHVTCGPCHSMRVEGESRRLNAGDGR